MRVSRSAAIVFVATLLVSVLILWGMKWIPKDAEAGLKHSTGVTTVLLLWFSTAILYKVLSARAGQDLFIRRIPGLAAIDEAVGRATELGRPIMFNYGIMGIGVETLQAMTILSHIARHVARYGMRVLVPVVDPQVLAITQGILREAYAAEGREDLYHPDDVVFLSGEQMAFAAGVVGIMCREKVAANFMVGCFYAEALIIAEAGQQLGAIQIAATPTPLQIPFFVATCDYVIIGDEYFAASAYLSREPTLLGSLVGQDWGKAMITSIVVLGAILITAGVWWPKAQQAHAFIVRQLGGM